MSPRRPLLQLRLWPILLKKSLLRARFLIPQRIDMLINGVYNQSLQSGRIEMTEIVAYLQNVKIRLGIKSDRQLAMKSEITQAAICSIMGGGSVPTDETCIRIALLAGDDPAYVIALARKSKASEASRPYWDRILKVLATAAVLGFFALNTAPLTVSHAEAFNTTLTSQTPLCILC